MLAVLRRPAGYTPRSDSGLARYERILTRAGLAPVAGIDEAGRGACAGPLVVAAAVLRPARSGAIPGIPGLADSKALTAQAREKTYRQIVQAAADWSVVIIPAGDVDRLGLHVCNVSGMRRALAGLATRPGYVLTDGFPVRGLAVPALAMWKGDQVAACVAAASILAKVTRDRIMSRLHEDFPEYGFSRHKGYSTPGHMKALAAHGPCPEHRRSFVNVAGAAARGGAVAPGAGVPGAGGPDGAVGDTGQDLHVSADLAGQAAEDLAGELAEAGVDSPDEVAVATAALAGPVGAAEHGHNSPMVNVSEDSASPDERLVVGRPGSAHRGASSA